MNSNTRCWYLKPVALLLSAMLVSGCSGSSDSPSPIESDALAFDDTALDTGNAGSLDEGTDGNAVIGTDTPSIEIADDAMNDASVASEGESVNTNSASSGSEGESVNTNPASVASESESVNTNLASVASEGESVNTNPASSESEDVTVNANPVVPDPLVQTRTQVNFDITVPAFQSDELQLRLNWGEVDITAGWVGDEFWSASADLPTDTEHTLNVTFYDYNGGIELARASQQYRTGVNAAETVAVGIEQFDASLFDTDEDGVNNLDELIAGTNPFTDEDALLPIEDFAPSLSFRVGQYEPHLTDERPLSLTFLPHPNDPNQNSLSGNLDIDIEGNGVLMRSTTSGARYSNFSGTRTHTDNSVSWEGSSDVYDGSDYLSMASFTNTITIVDENTRKFVEEFDNVAVGTYRFTQNRSMDLTGALIDGTSVCEPVAGTYFEDSFNGPRRTRTETSISKEIDDLYWRVVRVTRFIDREDEIETTEYFAKELMMFSGSSGTEPASFLCAFVDF